MVSGEKDPYRKFSYIHDGAATHRATGENEKAISQYEKMIDLAKKVERDFKVANRHTGKRERWKGMTWELVLSIIREHTPLNDAVKRDLTDTARKVYHITEAGRCDRYVPLELYEGVDRWFSGFLATWRAEPATVSGEPTAVWVLYSARVKMKLSSFSSTTSKVVQDREYTPAQ